MFDRLKTFFKGKDTADTSSAPKAKKFAPAAPVKDGKSKPEKGKSTGSTLKPLAKIAPTPEELCGITPKMSKDEIRAKLAILYRRYNRATSSLDAKLRAESEEMLDAVVAVRERVFGPI
jgi:hypothetical protein